MKIVLATHNSDKRMELIPLLEPLGFNILTLDEYPEMGEIIEDGSTLLENALIKARMVNKLTGLPSLGDDTGLEVDALNGAPGIFSARFAGEDCTYADNVKKLLLKLGNIEPPERTARFKTNMAFVDGDLELTAEGIVEGQIPDQPKGLGGFGYDSVFYIHKMNKTFAQMTTYEKSKISHRGIAVRKMAESLRRYYSNQNQSQNIKKETA